MRASYRPDTKGMISEPTELLADNPDWIRVLAAYVEAEQQLAETIEQQQQQPAASGEADDDDEQESPRSKKWLPRLREVEHIAPSQLPAIHGKLIAHGLLKFDLQGRNDGVVYRLTPQSRAAVGGVNLADLPISQPPDVEADTDQTVDEGSGTADAA